MPARKNKILHDDKAKDNIRGSTLVRMLTEIAETGTYMGVEVTEKRILAAKTVLPFIRPALQSVEQTVIDQRDNLDESQLVSQLGALFSAKPALFDKILAIQSLPPVHQILLLLAPTATHEASATQQ